VRIGAALAGGPDYFGAMRMEIDGRPASPDAELLLALGNYGHFTAMQVRDRRTRGLDLHLARLTSADREVFDRELDADLVRRHIRHALGDTLDASVRVYVTEASILVTVREPGETPATAQRLRSVRYQRSPAHIKHSSGFAQEYHRRAAARDGYDEVLLAAADGTVSEGGITNVGCWDGHAVQWPDAPALAGITMQLLERGLEERSIPTRHAPVRLSDLPGFEGVVVTNSRGIAPVEQVDDTSVPVSEGFTKLLTEIYQATAWDLI
jgi:branched-subunit amino acid aminotransferase/4-amino-4-deoxychorismate lyase